MWLEVDVSVLIITLCSQLMMSDVLEVVDAGASQWFDEALYGASRDPVPDVGKAASSRAASQDKMHLLLGCSIARDADLGVPDGDLLLRRARGGNTWAQVSADLADDVRRWREAAAAFGLDLGRPIIWLSGNEAYDRSSGCNLLADEPRGRLEAVIRVVLSTLRETSEPVVLGPLPRFWVDRLSPWEHTAAYKLDRKVREAAGADFISLGKTLTKKLRRRHVVVEECRQWFANDGIHLSPEGYQKVAGAALFPPWLRVNALTE